MDSCHPGRRLHGARPSASQQLRRRLHLRRPQQPRPRCRLPMPMQHSPAPLQQQLLPLHATAYAAPLHVRDPCWPRQGQNQGLQRYHARRRAASCAYDSCSSQHRLAAGLRAREAAAAAASSCPPLPAQPCDHRRQAHCRPCTRPRPRQRSRLARLHDHRPLLHRAAGSARALPAAGLWA